MADPTPPPDDDLGLFRRAQAGDYTAFEALVGRLQGRVYGLAYRILGQAQDAEDVVQQTFLSVIEHLDAFRGESAVATWVLRIATNFALKALRTKRGRPTVPLDAGPDDTYAAVPHPDFIAEWRDTPDALAERADLRAFLDRAVAELDDKHRVVFVLRDLEGLSTDETAGALGLSVANVKVRLLRARMQLRERLTRAFGDGATRVRPAHDH
ncbi:MAG TPA: sigma-70 family RNA polymerase sigma factor [Gemmataceae bacterium]|jgi:RNA polymerase sigma-70 factor (ECF subfamily)|nr:sigma-70 family RNA polymerase sigma factor [Gemmataceae bacterium]